jgi:hypothetical protein
MDLPSNVGTVSATKRALDEHAEFIRKFVRTTVRDAIEAGRRLTEAKELCGHGNWLAWLHHEFEWDERSARRFICVYELSLKSDTVADLDLKIPLIAVYALAAPSTPPSAVEAVIAKVHAGELPTASDVKATIAKAKQKPRLPSFAPSTVPADDDRHPDFAKVERLVEAFLGLNKAEQRQFFFAIGFGQLAGRPIIKNEEVLF